MHNHCFVCSSRLNWFCGMYNAEIPLIRKLPQCTIKINPAILQEKLKKRSAFKDFIIRQSRMKNE